MTDTNYYLSEAEIEFYRRQGYVGPLKCRNPSLQRLPAFASERGAVGKDMEVPIPHPKEWADTDVERINLYDPHLIDEELLAMCCHSSIVAPVSQLLDSEDVMLVHSRLRVKFAGRPDSVPWHQDVAIYDAGLYADGSPIPSISAWIALEDVPTECGPITLIPGTQKNLYGDWRKGFHGLVGRPLEAEGVDVSEAVVLPAGPLEFYLFDSWTIHRSLDNVSDKPRVAFVLRFVHPRDAIRDDIDYIALNPCST